MHAQQVDRTGRAHGNTQLCHEAIGPGQPCRGYVSLSPRLLHPLDKPSQVEFDRVRAFPELPKKDSFPSFLISPEDGSRLPASVRRLALSFSTYVLTSRSTRQMISFPVRTLGWRRPNAAVVAWRGSAGFVGRWPSRWDYKKAPPSPTFLPPPSSSLLSSSQSNIFF